MRKTNKQILVEVNEKREIVQNKNSRKSKLFGHLSRYNAFVNVIKEWKVLNKQTRSWFSVYIDKT